MIKSKSDSKLTGKEQAAQNDRFETKSGSDLSAQLLSENMFNTTGRDMNDALYHWHRFWLNLEAPSNINVISVTQLTSHLSMD